MKAEKPRGAHHGDNINGLIRTKQANWSEAPLQYVGGDSNDECGTDSSARQFGRVQNVPGRLQGFFQNSVI